MAGVEIQTERVDDVPLLIYQQQEMGIAKVLDEVMHPHGNWQGLSIRLVDRRLDELHSV